LAPKTEFLLPVPKTESGPVPKTKGFGIKLCFSEGKGDRRERERKGLILVLFK